MSQLSKQQADQVAKHLRSNFGNVASVEARTQLSGAGKILVEHDANLDEATLKAMETAANTAAGRPLVRGEIEFTTGKKHDTGHRY